MKNIVTILLALAFSSSVALADDKAVPADDHKDAATQSDATTLPADQAPADEAAGKDKKSENTAN